MAALQIKRICEQRNLGQVKDALSTMSKDLFETYDSTLERICKQSERDRELGIKVMAWISHARRPLTIDELRHALSIEYIHENDRPRKLDSDRFFRPKHLVEVCVGLVVLEDESGIIRFIHKTAQEYVTRPENEERYFGDAQLQLAKICLTYLLFDDFSRDNCNSEDQFIQCLQKFALLDYAAKYWYKHAKTADEKFPLATLAIQLLDEESSSFLNWLRIREPDRPWTSPAFQKKLSGFGSNIYYAAYCGLSETTRLLLKADADVNARGYYGSVLQAASVEGHDAVVQRLLEAGADINAQGGEYGNALQAASEKGHDSVVQRLLEAGADVNAQGG
jgi:hypothetical protein